MRTAAYAGCPGQLGGFSLRSSMLNPADAGNRSRTASSIRRASDSSRRCGSPVPIATMTSATRL